MYSTRRTKAKEVRPSRLNLTVDLGDGINGEIQVHTKQSWKFKQITDKIYRRWRNYREEDIAKLPQSLQAKHQRDIDRCSQLWDNFFEKVPLEVREAVTSAVMGLPSQSLPRVIPSSEVTGRQVPESKISGTRPERRGRKSSTRPSESLQKSGIVSPPEPSITEAGEGIKIPAGRPVEAPVLETGKPFKATLYRGEGKPKSEIYKVIEKPVVGEGLYAAFNEADARLYGDKISRTEVSLDNPLVIRNEDDWRRITREWADTFAKPHGMTKEQVSEWVDRIKDAIVRKGYDGVIVQISKDPYEETETLRNLFGHAPVPRRGYYPAW